MFINQTILTIILASVSGLLLFWNFWQQFSLRKIKQKQALLFQGKKAKNLEEIILEQQKNLINLSKQSKRLFEITDTLTSASNMGLSKVGMVRFNPFKNLGGNQSFAVAFLNNYSNGLIISSIYSGEGSRFYAKTILKGKSLPQYPLTKEEQEAINIATGKK
jgi:hypothetical protein